MSVFAPVHTLGDLNSLNEADIIEGYMTTRRGDPEPGENRGRAFWHGWRCRMIDYGEIENDAGHMKLVHEYLKQCRGEREAALFSPPAKKEGER